jgi:hypothetical protein
VGDSRVLTLQPCSPASAPIWKLSSGYSSEVKEVKPVVAIQAHVDDSASEVADRKLFLAGYINMASNRILFSDAWREELNTAPSIDYLKMSEAQNLSGQFRGWDADVSDARVKGLAGVIRHFKPNSIHCLVSRRGFKENLEPVAPFGFGRSSFHIFQRLMEDLARAQAESRNPFSKVPIDFIFEQQQETDHEVRQFCELIRETYPGPIRACFSKSPIFAGDKLVLPLQAADMFAWHIHRDNETKTEHPPNPPSPLASPGSQYLALALDAPRKTVRAKGFKQVPGARFLKRKIARKKSHRSGQRRIEQGIGPSLRLIRLKNNLTYFATRIKNALLSLVGRRPRL